MKICLNCKLEYEDKYAFCHKCGSKLQEKIVYIFCPYCGKRFETQEEYCPYCGQCLKDESLIDNKQNPIHISKKPYSPEVNVKKNYVKMQPLSHTDDLCRSQVKTIPINYIIVSAFLIIIGIFSFLYNKSLYDEAFMYKLYDVGILNIIAKEEHYANAYNYAYSFDREGDYSEAFKWYKLSAEGGYAPAQNNLGIMYEEGKGVGKDNNKAFNWYLKSAEQGNVTAQYNVGSCYLRGKGVNKDLKKAEEWFTKAAEMGDVAAMNMVEKINPNAPIPWLKK